jgi:hypothetical protein
MIFALSLIALDSSEVNLPMTSVVGWIVIAIAWSVLGALRLAGSLLAAQVLRNQVQISEHG